MVFILDRNFHPAKFVKKALECFYALGPKASERILAKHSIHPRARIGTLSPKTILALTSDLSQMTIDNEARKALQDRIKMLYEIGTYRGRRHYVHLPVRGQRTRNQINCALKFNRVERWG